MGSVSLIPLRGNENEMRRSVAAFAADPLSVSGSPSLWAGLRLGWMLPPTRLTSLLLLSECPGALLLCPQKES